MGSHPPPGQSDFAVIRGFLFIACFAAWLVAAKALNSGTFRFRKPLLFYLGTSVLAFAGFTSFLTLHAGGIDWRAVLAFAAMSTVSPVATCVVRCFYPLRQELFEAIAAWSFLGKPRATKFILFPIGTCLAAYLVVVVWTIVVPVSNPVRFAVQSAILAFALMAIPTLLWIFSVLAAHYWTEEIRTVVALYMFPGVFNALILLALGLWSFDLGGAGKQLFLLGSRVSFSPLIFISCVSAMALLYLLPFLRGAATGKETAVRFQKSRLDAIDNIILELSSPKAAPDKVLHEIRTRLEADMDAFWDRFPVLGIAGGIEKDTSPAPVFKELVILARANDFRYLQWHWFLELTMKLEESEQDLASMDGAALSAAVSQWIKFYEGLRSIHQKHLADVSGSKAKLLVVASVLATFILTKGLELLWKYVEDWIK